MLDFSYGDGHYTSSLVKDDEEGWIGLELYLDQGGEPTCVAKVIYWDACGQFFVETCGIDVPLSVLDRAIAEAKSIIAK